MLGFTNEDGCIIRGGFYITVFVETALIGELGCE